MVSEDRRVLELIAPKFTNGHLCKCTNRIDIGLVLDEAMEQLVNLVMHMMDN